MENKDLQTQGKRLYSTYKLLLRFVLLSFLILTSSRLLLVTYHQDRISIDELLPLFIGGLRIDLCLIGMFAALPAVLTSFLSNSEQFRWWESMYYRAAIVVLVFFEAITPQFIAEYDTRPNRLFFEYLGHASEVSSMLLKGFGASVLAVVLILAVSIIVVPRLLPQAETNELPLRSRAIGAFVCAFLCFAFIRGTIAHRPISPATVAFASDRMVNTLPLNSTYNLFYALYRMKDEKNASALYGSLPDAEMHELVRTAAGLTGKPLDANRPSLHFSKANMKRTSAPNVVIILEESLGARYVGHLSGAPYTPEMDALAKEAWTFTNLFATGTRSVRGIEAVITGFLPTPARAVVKLGLAQDNFFTLADVFNAEGYESTFIYGGESHFDNMRGFLLNNGFQRIIDKPKFHDVVFSGTWGVSDEDMFNRVHEELQNANQPQFIFAFSVSNHSPYEYPEGRIQVHGSNPATKFNTVRYADWAIGDFFRKAKQSAYYDNTIFLLVADHDSRVYGASLIPVEHFHIPAMFLGSMVPTQFDNRLASQIDLAPTLLSLAGIDAYHPMLGRDLTDRDVAEPGRALMQYGDNFGYQEGNRLLVLQPQLGARQFQVTEDLRLVPLPLESELQRRALAHALWPSWAYRNQRYNPHI